MAGFFGRGLEDERLIQQVSILEIMGIQHETFSEVKSLFPGKKHKDEKAFLTEFGISDDLKPERDCSKSELNNLLMELRMKMIPYFSLKGQVISLKRRKDSAENQDQIEGVKKMYKDAKAKLKQQLDKVFACIVNRTASKYRNCTMSRNHFDCKMHTYIYHSSMKKLNKKITKLLEEAFVSFSKSRGNCRVNKSGIHHTTCNHLFYSVRAIKQSITAQTSQYFQFKRMKKRCQPYVAIRIRKFIRK
ncbi:hypothetical protein OIY81_598 [Cryptosporidium canis]|uniref:Uncharacterized protein n=1 Tax=Cryptosporidium canis TaxID=195482 RepID=A0ABQ8P2Y5_9CRYT|nr:hypothetical protein OJ252_3237 [Cryptosporidium canis]KAJ1614225.1 hypothetical protein OIY81_598 [Cryptosporidium canis]